MKGPEYHNTLWTCTCAVVIVTLTVGLTFWLAVLSWA